MSAMVKLEMPKSAAKQRLPRAVHQRLQSLLDKQDNGEKLTRAERDEAAGLVELAEMLSLIRLRSRSKAK